MTPIKEQIQAAVEVYVKNNMDMPEWEKISPRMKLAIAITMKSAMLSGMSLTAHFLSANDGHPDITPQAFEKAALEVGRELNLTAEQLNAALNPKPKDPPDTKV